MTGKQAKTSMGSKQTLAWQASKNKHGEQTNKNKHGGASKQNGQQAWQTKVSDMASIYIHTKTTQANQANNAWRANTFRQSNISIASKNEHGELTQA